MTTINFDNFDPRSADDETLADLVGDPGVPARINRMAREERARRRQQEFERERKQKQQQEAQEKKKERQRRQRLEEEKRRRLQELLNETPTERLEQYADPNASHYSGHRLWSGVPWDVWRQDLGDEFTPSKSEIIEAANEELRSRQGQQSQDDQVTQDEWNRAISILREELDGAQLAQIAGTGQSGRAFGMVPDRVWQILGTKALVTQAADRAAALEGFEPTAHQQRQKPLQRFVSRFFGGAP